MTINEAYVKGLDKAEDDALEKITKALDGLDAGPFANPKMEDLRQKILQRATPEVGVDENIVTNDISSIPCWMLREILLYEGSHIPYGMTTFQGQIIDTLTNLMTFIYTKAAKGNNGSKNYIQMVEDIKSGLLTNDESVLK